MKMLAPITAITGTSGIGLAIHSMRRRMIPAALFASWPNLTIVGVVGIANGSMDLKSGTFEAQTNGGHCLALAALAGAIAQCLSVSFGTGIRPRSKDRKPRGGDEAAWAGIWGCMHLMVAAAAATVSQKIMAYTDMRFASFTEGAAVLMGGGTLLAASPIGLVSTALMTHLTPWMANSRSPADLARRLRRSLVVVAFSTAAAGAALVALAPVLACFLNAGGITTGGGASQVAKLMAASVAGCSARAVRDVSLHGCLILGDPRSPLAVDALAVVLNVALDWLCVSHLQWGPLGLIMATQVVSILSTGLQLLLLKRRLKHFRLSLIDMLPTAIIAAISGCYCWI
eukprot:evm.model.scf_1306.3 EVM.evm.TU.scf_1306.3   scf_1306:14830-18157(+)